MVDWRLRFDERLVIVGWGPAVKFVVQGALWTIGKLECRVHDWPG